MINKLFLNYRDLENIDEQTDRGLSLRLLKPPSLRSN